MASKFRKGTITHPSATAGDVYAMLAGEADANELRLIDMRLPPGFGPVSHRHDFEDAFQVLEGECVVTFRGNAVTLRAGETANIPANAPHFIHNCTGKTAHVVCTRVSAGQDVLFPAVATPDASRALKEAKHGNDAHAAVVAKAAAAAPNYSIEVV